MRLELIFPLQRGAALPIELCSLAHFINILLERVDSNHRSRKTADLQSAAFDRSATLQFIFFCATGQTRTVTSFDTCS